MVGFFGFQVRNARLRVILELPKINWHKAGVWISIGGIGEFILGALTYLKSVMFIKGNESLFLTQKIKYRKLCYEFKFSIVWNRITHKLTSQFMSLSSCWWSYRDSWIKGLGQTSGNLEEEKNTWRSEEKNIWKSGQKTSGNLDKNLWKSGRRKKTSGDLKIKTSINLEKKHLETKHLANSKPPLWRWTNMLRGRCGENLVNWLRIALHSWQRARCNSLN